MSSIWKIFPILLCGFLKRILFIPRPKNIRTVAANLAKLRLETGHPGTGLITDQRPSCTLKVLGAGKIRRGCNVFQVPYKINTTGDTLSKWWILSKDQNCEFCRFWATSRPSGIAHCVVLVDIKPTQLTNQPKSIQALQNALKNENNIPPPGLYFFKL